MKSLLNALVCALVMLGFARSAFAADAAPPPTQGPVYTTTFVEVAPAATAQTIAMLKEYRDAARKEPGMMLVDIYQEAGTPSRFVSNEVWRDWATYDEHAKAAARAQLFQKLKPIQYGPPDGRTHLAHFAGPQTPGGANSIFILSHLDVTPNQLPKLMELMKPLSEASAKEAGVQTYQILRQAPGTGNHFRLFEIWASEQAFNAHNLAPHTQTFRDELAPLLGTPYDQRKYLHVN